MDTNVIILMIICATVIALVSIVCDYLFERKISDITDCFMSKKIIKVHRNYIAGFLSFAVIMLITGKYGGPDNEIFTYLSFGSTITSLVLSVLAIFVTVQSSSDIYKQFGTINKVSIQIENTLTNLKEAENNLEKTSTDISCQMNSIVDEIGKRLNDRMQKTEETLSEQIQMQNITLQNTTNDKTTNMNSNSFLKRISYNGLLVIYACLRGAETGKIFNLNSLFKGNENYQLGVVVTTFAAGYITGSVHKSGDNCIVKCVDSGIKSEDVYKIIVKSSSGYGANAEESTKVINEYFDKE